VFGSFDFVSICPVFLLFVWTCDLSSVLLNKGTCLLLSISKSKKWDYLILSLLSGVCAMHFCSILIHLDKDPQGLVRTDYITSIHIMVKHASCLISGIFDKWNAQSSLLSLPFNRGEVELNFYKSYWSFSSHSNPRPFKPIFQKMWATPFSTSHSSLKKIVCGTHYSLDHDLGW